MIAKKKTMIPDSAARKAADRILREFADNKVYRLAHLDELVRIREGKLPDPNRNPAVRISVVGMLIELAGPPRARRRHRPRSRARR